MDTPKKYVAFFDLDKTILDINSGSVMVKEAYRSGLMGTSGILKAFYLSLLYKLNLRDTSHIISGMAKWLKGMSSDQLNTLTEESVKRYLINAIRPQVYNELKLHRDNGAEVVILSSAIIEICRPIGYHLGIDNYICTVMGSSDGILTGLPIEKFCFEQEKRVRLNKYCNERDYKLSEAYYYGDSIADLPALEIVGNPVCITPDRKLTQIAQSRRWRIDEW